MNIKRRVENLENTNRGYAGLEEILEIIALESRANLTPVERARLKKLRSLPTEPSFLRALESLAAIRKGERANEH